MSDIGIRHLSSSDYGPVVAVVDAWWGGRRMADMLPRLFFTHFQPTSFAAERDGELAGFLVGFVSQTDAREAYIHFVGVDPELRQSNVGRILYRTFFDAVAEHGCELVRCVTSPVNEGSIAFHRSMGFSMAQGDTVVDGVPVATAYDGEGEDRVLFFRRLDQ